MRPPRLPGRLRALDAFVPEEAGTIADVGAGHGALSVHLARQMSTVIATEAKPGPFAELQRNLRAWDAAGVVDARLGLDLEPLNPGEADVVVVAGIGARTAIRICSQAAAKAVRWIVLQCVQDCDEVEPWLAGCGWRVVRRDDIVERGHTYPTWLVEVHS
jgi:tRNA (adenine22-N1)-methyltransferase